MRVITFDEPNQSTMVELEPDGDALALRVVGPSTLKLLQHEWEQLKAKVDEEFARLHSHK